MITASQKPEPEIIDGTWYVCVCESQQEPIALAGLHARGFTCYFPSYPKTRTGNYNKPRVVYRPMLPGYIFASFDPNANAWKAIPGINGIRRIIMRDERPIPVPEAALCFIREREAQLKADFGTRKRWFMPIKKGDWVQITEHTSFGGLFGRVIHLLAEKGKMVLEIDFAVRAQKVEVSVHQIRTV